MTRTRTQIMLVALTIIVASCSSQGDTSQIATLEPGTTESSNAVSVIGDPLAEAEEAMLAFTECLRDQGGEVADPDISPGGGIVHLGGMEDDEFAAADAICRSVFESFSIGG